MWDFFHACDRVRAKVPGGVYRCEKIFYGRLKMNSKKTVQSQAIKLCECAIMIALAIVLDFFSKGISSFIFPDIWVNGGGITLFMVPLVFIAYRHGNKWGLLTAFVFSGIQILTGWYAPPAGTALSFVLCVLLDYVLAFTVLGLSNFFASFIKDKVLGYAFGAFVVCMLRFVCSFLSGAILWGEYITWGFTSVWLYSFVYNISYMLPNAILTSVIIYGLCKVMDPKTLKRNVKEAQNEEQ